MTGGVTYYDNGIQIPLQGNAYNIATGYKKYVDCKLITDGKDPASITNDVLISLGECTVRTGIDALIEAGFETQVSLKHNDWRLDAVISLSKWDKERVVFTNNKFTLGVGIVFRGYFGIMRFLQ